MTKTVVSLDPGKTTGVVHTQIPFIGHDTSCHQVQGIESVIQALSTCKPDLIIAEQFRLLRSRALQLSGQVMYASEVLGAIKNYCQQNSIELVLQQPFAKNTISNKLLQASGLWEPTKGLPHARDAARHLVYYLLQQCPDMVTALWEQHRLKDL